MSREGKIRLRLLGTAAGGGLPQWNCACANCTAARRGTIPARTQSSVAIQADGGPWMLINTSPDLRAQINAFPALSPASGRDTPVRDVLLTNADLDHVLGLFLLREHRLKLRVRCTVAVRETLQHGLRMDGVLGGYCGVEWHDLPGEDAPVNLAESGFALRTIPLPGGSPRYSRGGGSSEGQSAALEFTHEQRDVRIVVAPDVAAITPELTVALEAADLVLFDGTFWSEDELRRIDPVARTASEMGHLPVAHGSLGVLRNLRARTRVYVHINNTNPILAPDSAERAEVTGAGVLVGEDGMEFEL